MMVPKKDAKQLEGWKEISTYLDRSIKFCQRAEKSKGMPIRRMDKSVRARVHAYKDELDKWQDEVLKLKQNPSPLSPGLKLKKLWPLPLMAVFGFFMVMLLGMQGKILLHPFDYRIDGSSLVILDDQGQELWRKDTSQNDLHSNNSYKEHSQNKSRTIDDHVNFPWIIIKDINRDGYNEVMFSIQTESEFGEGRFFCYSHDGAELWNYDVGKTIEIGSDWFSSPYRVMGFITHDYDSDDRDEIYLIGVHRPHFPCQLSVLDCEGKLIGEYWNAGYFSDLEFADIDGDGVEELLASGQNEEYLKGIFCGFEIQNISGYSPQIKEKYQAPALGQGSELFYLLFPRTEEDRLLSINEAITTINLYEGKQIELLTYAGRLRFVMDFSLAPLTLRLGHRFKKIHDDAKRSGLITYDWNDEMNKRLLDKILYWGESGWKTYEEITGL